MAWNVRWAGGRTFPGLILDLVNRHNIDLLFLFETRISGNRAEKVLGKLGFPYYWKVDASGFSGGIWLLWNSGLTVDVVQVHT